MTSAMLRETRTIEALFAKLMRCPKHFFPTRRKELKSPRRKGVYLIADPAGRILHVGDTPRAKNGIYQRLRDHLAGRSSFTKKFAKPNGIDLRTGCTYQFIVVESGRQRRLLECYAIGRLCPQHVGFS